MATLSVSEEQLRLIQRALDFYSRVGMGQFKEIKNHPTFQNNILNQFKDENGKIDYTRYHDVRDVVDMMLIVPRNILCNEKLLGSNGHWGIHHPNVDDSCRDAFDLIQVIRHEFWKREPDRSPVTVDSSVLLTGEKNSNIKVEL